MTEETLHHINTVPALILDAAMTKKDWFGFHEQRITAILLAHEIAANHADKMSPDEIVDFALMLNHKIYHKIIKG